MSRPVSCSFKKEFLQKSTILYVEDEDEIRLDAKEIFEGFFKKVYTATDGEEGFELFLKHHKEIDVILTDINMPKLTGLELLAKIREVDWEIPVLITTAFQESDILLKAIKFNVTNYILKPMQLNTTFKIISMIVEDIENAKSLRIKEHETKQLMAILDSQNLICEFDLDGNILYVNDLFTLATGYSHDEMLCKKHHDLAHPSISQKQYDEAMSVIEGGHSKVCECRKSTKEDTIVYTHTTLLPIFDINGNITKFMEFSTLTTKYESEILSLKKHILALKNESFRSNLEHKNEQNHYEKLSEKLQKQIDETVNGSQQLIFEIQQLKKNNKNLEEKLEEQERRFEQYQEKCGR